MATNHPTTARPSLKSNDITRALLSDTNAQIQINLRKLMGMILSQIQISDNGAYFLGKDEW